MTHRVLIGVLAAVCAVLFGAGLLRLVLWRFGVGDVYPAYSSLRADPLGCMALWEALDALPGVRSERCLDPTAALPEGGGACLLVLGATADLAGSQNELADLDGFMLAGGRVVVALDARGPDEHRAARLPLDTGEPGTGPATRLSRHWGYVFHAAAGIRGEEATLDAAWTEGPVALPARLSWHGRRGLKLGDDAWRRVYAVGDEPVVACRSMGAGMLVLVADAYGFSNEGLREAPEPEFLSWAIGASARVVFDETHLGIQRRRGIMALARRYGLEGLCAALGVLAILGLWRSATRWPVAVPAGAATDAIGGRAAQSALVDLVRRHTPREAVLERCVDAWARTGPLPRAAAGRVHERLRERLREQAGDAVLRRHPERGYRELCEIAVRRGRGPDEAGMATGDRGRNTQGLRREG